jgi:hypothetical protein
MVCFNGFAQPAVAASSNAASLGVDLSSSIAANQSTVTGESPAMSQPFRFGVYPGGGTGETPNAPNPDGNAVVRRIQDLASGQPMVVHLYTAWSWFDATQLDAQIQHYAGAGFDVILTVKYSPPVGHDGDVAGFADFVRRVVDRYGAKPGITAFVIGNEANVPGVPNAADGAFARVDQAVTRGSVVARDAIAHAGSSARVGINFGVTGTASDAAFLGRLEEAGGRDFLDSIQFIGIDVYPGLWPSGTGQLYAETVVDLESARTSVNSIVAWQGLPIEILEMGAPMVDESDQAYRLTQFVKAVLDSRDRLQIASLIWFDLWDANSQSTNQFNHYGLLRSDFSVKPAFLAYRNLIAAGAHS